MLAEILEGLRTRSDADVFLGADRITQHEFADLVWTYAGGLRLRQARSVALVGRPGPTTVAMMLAGIGTGTRVDWVDPRAGEAYVRARIEAAAPDIAIAESGLAWPLKGPKWLRRSMGLPSIDVWPEIVPIDHIGAAQQRSFGLEPEAPALTLFPRGRLEEPIGVVHSVASLSAGLRGLAAIDEGGGAVLTDSLLAMLAAVGGGRPIVRASRAGAVPKQLRRHAVECSYLASWDEVSGTGARLTGTVVVDATAPATTLHSLRGSGADRVMRVYALPELFPIAHSDTDGVLELTDGVEARVADDGTLRLRGRAMAPRTIEGPYLDDVTSRGRLAGRTLRLADA
ncbi:MAG: hypothetical protein GX596_15050 [Propionibacterium sp.]|nr:hypothetical protein [Propionibacterium sp.]